MPSGLYFSNLLNIFEALESGTLLLCVWRAGRHFNDDDDVLRRGACGPKLTLVNQNVERVEERGGSIFRMRRRKNKRGTDGERCAAILNVCCKVDSSLGGKPTNAAMNGFVYGRKSHHYSSPFTSADAER